VVGERERKAQERVPEKKGVVIKKRNKNKKEGSKDRLAKGTQVREKGESFRRR